MKTAEEAVEDRDNAILDARAILRNPYFVLDTETTGLSKAQMCQVAILHADGKQYKSLVKPTIPIEEGASAVHKITNDMVREAPDALEVLKHIPIFGVMVIYNAPFDLGVLKHSANARGAIFSEEINSAIFDAMQIYSNFRGEWDEYHGNYRWHKLGVACNQCKIEIDVKLHDAMSDCILTDRLIKYIASQKLSDEEEDDNELPY
jgi:DNA polymerase-3 subunit epsilon